MSGFDYYCAPYFYPNDLRSAFVGDHHASQDCWNSLFHDYGSQIDAHKIQSGGSRYFYAEGIFLCSYCAVASCGSFYEELFSLNMVKFVAP